MKNLLLSSILVFFLSVLLIGCKKENSNNGSGGSNGSKEGSISVSINHKPSTNSTFAYSYGQTEVRLHRDGSLVSTMYASPNNPNVNFGSFDYGNYRVDAFTTRIKFNSSNGKTTYHDLSKVESFKLDSKNKNISISF